MGLVVDKETPAGQIWTEWGIPIYFVGGGLCACGCGVEVKNQRALGHARRSSPAPYLKREGNLDTPCWEWQRKTLANGYGAVQHGARTRLAHRVYYEMEKGDIPDGLQLDHLCRNRACVNPNHLEPVTNFENHYRGANTKLTRQDVAEIRSSHEREHVLAARFGVHQSTINKIRKGTERRAG